MAFPTTGILDNFNRSNEGPPPSGSWSTPTFTTGCKVVSNECVADTSGTNPGSGVYDTDYGPDSEVFCTISAKGEVNYSHGLIIRGLQTGSGATIDGYWLQVVAKSGTDNIVINRLDDGALTQLGATIDQEFSTGDKVGLEVIGTSNNLRAYIDTGGGWTLLDTYRSDSTYQSAGRLGIYLGTDAKFIDDFGGGTVVESTTILPMALLQMNHFNGGSI